MKVALQDNTARSAAADPLDRLLVLQANVAKSTAATNAALQLAAAEGAAVVLLQEVASFEVAGARFFANHQAYVSFPCQEGNSGPRVVTYVRRDLAHTTTVVGSFFSGVTIGIRGWTVSNFHIVPANKDTLEGLETAPAPGSSWVLAGDFNCTHPSWDPHSTTVSGGDGGYLHRLVSSHDGAYTGDSVPTRHNGRRVIDLAFSNHGDVVAETATENLLGSDHKHLWITLPPSPLPGAPDPRAPRPCPVALRRILQGLLLPASEPPPVSSVTELESSAKLLMSLLTEAARAAAPPVGSTRLKTRTNWWNEECEAAREAMKNAQEPHRKARVKVFSRTVREAKKAAWKAYLVGKGPHWAAARTLKTGSRGFRTGPGRQKTPEDSFREYFKKSFPENPPTASGELPPPPQCAHALGRVGLPRRGLLGVYKGKILHPRQRQPGQACPERGVAGGGTLDPVCVQGVALAGALSVRLPGCARRTDPQAQWHWATTYLPDPYGGQGTR